MRAFGLLSIVAALNLALPVISSTLLPRKQVCANDGKTVAGTIFSRELTEPSSSLQARDYPPLPCTWCQLGSATYIIIHALQIPGILLNPHQSFFQSQGIAAATDLLRISIQDNGDYVLPSGTYTYQDEWVLIRAVNANNHQLTRGVVLSAFLALRSCLIAYGVYGWAAFDIYDGENHVGAGNLYLLDGSRR